MNLQYGLATETWDEEEIEAIQDVIKSKWHTNGQKVKAFEEKFAKYVGSKYAVMVNSGSSANLLGIASVFYGDYGLNTGDEVLVPAISWSTTYYPLQQLGLMMRFVDVDINTLNIDINKIEEAITPKTKGIFAVNLLGNPCDLNALKALCKKYNLIRMEDNCESLGATLEGKHTGTFGLFGTYSTFFSHHMCTIEGGLVVTEDKDLYHLILSLRSHGWLREQPEDSKLFIKGLDDFDKSFKFILPGYNLRPIEMQGAIGIKQLDKLPTMIVERQKNGTFWSEKMKKIDNYIIQDNFCRSSWFGFSIFLKEKLQGRRKEILAKLTNAGVEVRPIVSGNFLKNPVIKHLPHSASGEMTVADYVHENGFFIGNHHYNVRDKIEAIINILNNI